MVNSRQKGARGEREWAAVLRNWGYAARRGQQFSGSPDSPDVVTDCPFHFEVKRVQALNLDKAMRQAINDAGDDMPAVAHRKNQGEWLVTMRALDFFNILRPLQSSSNDGEKSPGSEE